MDLSTSTGKINRVKHEINELRLIQGDKFRYDFYVIADEWPPDLAPLLSIEDQKCIIKNLAEKGLVEIMDDSDPKVFLLRIKDKLDLDVVVEINGLPTFNAEKSRLYIGDKEIKIQKFSDPYHMAEIIFENREALRDEWFFSRIDERLMEEPINIDKKYYNAAYCLQQKIAMETGIKDFLILTKQSVRINPDYLPKLK